jgi:hypothetical protein
LILGAIFARALKVVSSFAVSFEKQQLTYVRRPIQLEHSCSANCFSRGDVGAGQVRVLADRARAQKKVFFATSENPCPYIAEIPSC